jgi:hypothetical protein
MIILVFFTTNVIFELDKNIHNMISIIIIIFSLFLFPLGGSGSFIFELQGGNFTDILGNTFTTITETPQDVRQLSALIIDTTPSIVTRVNSLSDDGVYFPGQILDIFVRFSIPVSILSSNLPPSTPSIEIFAPYQSEFASVARYSYGNNTNELHFSFFIPPPPVNIDIEPSVTFDYSNTAALFTYLNGTTIVSQVTSRGLAPREPANVDLPTTDR